MRGIVFHGDCTLELANVPDPTPGFGEVVVEIKASGMCGSDLHLYRRPRSEIVAPKIVGHEPCGVVAAVGPGVVTKHAQIGNRVMVHHYHGCTCCDECHSGWPQLCQTAPATVYGFDAHGGHATYMKVPARTLVPLDERLSFAAGAAISCGTGTAWGAFERIGLTGRDTIAIFGQGPVGQSATLLAKAQGACVIALDIDENRRRAASSFGADYVLNPRDGRTSEAIREVTNGRGASVILETSGASAAAHDALNSVSPWGTVCLVGIGAEVNFSVAAMLRSQIRILTSLTMSIQAQHACSRFVVERGIDLDSLFTDRWALDQAELAYQTFNQQSGGKGVFLL
ncbi:zinc-binding dehydrogenase [Caballeronia novacaledonica]|uniref:Zinc-binding dehydrogenase n=1 Tax=Caballeronia novacaledonica TaxID=1544861 RepID=A0AA37IHS9_9BURK|nr:zinc-binding dehydrogenase [Caballeronia novacaledonica]GJH30066.1 zinc-binding dehydrogenase [Caballeronia novacaledonica]